jgi:hypothetical protein
LPGEAWHGEVRRKNIRINWLRERFEEVEEFPHLTKEEKKFAIGSDLRICSALIRIRLSILMVIGSGTKARQKIKC